ncbi:Ubiquitin-conjugating enzyme [Asimina triloba]
MRLESMQNRWRSDSAAPPEATVSNKRWARSIQQQWAMLKDGLPPSIFVVAYEDWIDLMRAVIVGPQGTPYQDGLSFFDIKFPSSYPRAPPLVHFHSHRLHVNPNLYANDTVSLSLLNTWNESSDESYSEVALLESSKLVVYSMRRPPQHFEELVRQHFNGRARPIMEACRLQQITDSERRAKIEYLLPMLED